MARVYLVAGLGFGDEGKGTIVDFLTRSTGAHLVVRYNGGAQAAHNVVLPDGTSHCFSQFGSGSFVPRVQTHLSRHMLVNPLTMNHEGSHLLSLGVRDIWDRVTVDRQALITNPFQRAANRLREHARGDARHGSCGMGVGETMSDALADPESALRVGDLEDRALTVRKLRQSQERKAEEFRDHLRLSDVGDEDGLDGCRDVLRDTTWPEDIAESFQDWTSRVTLVNEDWLTGQVNGEGVVIFEGAQGVLLDETYGFQPYTTWTSCTWKNAMDLLKDHQDANVKVGVLRTYMTRHGRGPFVTEDTGWVPSEKHNRRGDWQEGFRRGYFDIPAVHYAIDMLYDSARDGLDMFAMTHMDVIPPKFCTKYDNFDLQYLSVANSPVGRQEKVTEILLQPDVRPVYQKIDLMPDFLAYIEAEFGTDIGIFSYGPTHEDKSLHARY